MINQLRLIIHKKKSIYDDANVSLKFVCQYKNASAVKDCKETIKICNCAQKELLLVPLQKKGFNAYLISIYMHTMSRSNIYRKSAISALEDFLKMKFPKLDLFNSVILIKLKTPRYQFIDYGWNDRLTRMAREREEIDHAMSWLSTLGGAFSALGDKFDHCAKIAGKISVEQFKLAMRLGDPQLLARCELYAALSLLQQGYFKATRNMVKKIFKFAIRDKDVRLQRMCQGVWAKLSYCYHQRKQGV